MKALIILILYIAAFVTFVYGQEGPAGASNDATNRFWFKTSDVTESNGSTVQTWHNEGGNNGNAFQSANSRRPIMKDNSMDNIKRLPCPFL